MSPDKIVLEEQDEACFVCLKRMYHFLHCRLKEKGPICGTSPPRLFVIMVAIQIELVSEFGFTEDVARHASRRSVDMIYGGCVYLGEYLIQALDIHDELEVSDKENERS